MNKWKEANGMKNWKKGVAAGILVLGLAACNAPAELKTDPETGEKVEIEKESTMTAQQVYEKTVEALKGQTSMHARVGIFQKIDVPAKDFTMGTKVQANSDIIINPLTIYQKMDIAMGGQETTAMEFYITEEEFFMNGPPSEKWAMLSGDMYAEILGEMGSVNTNHMSMFEAFVEDFKFEQTDGEYILKLSGSGGKFSELFIEIWLGNLPEGVTAADGAEELENMKETSVEIEIFIDKKTYYINALKTRVDMTILVEGEETQMNQKVRTKLSKINKIDKIEVPQEVLDEALEMNEKMGQ